MDSSDEEDDSVQQEGYTVYVESSEDSEPSLEGSVPGLTKRLVYEDSSDEESEESLPSYPDLSAHYLRAPVYDDTSDDESIESYMNHTGPDFQWDRTEDFDSFLEGILARIAINRNSYTRPPVLDESEEELIREMGFTGPYFDDMSDGIPPESDNDTDSDGESVSEEAGHTCLFIATHESDEDTSSDESSIESFPPLRDFPTLQETLTLATLPFEAQWRERDDSSVASEDTERSAGTISGESLQTSLDNANLRTMMTRLTKDEPQPYQEKEERRSKLKHLHELQIGLVPWEPSKGVHCIVKVILTDFSGTKQWPIHALVDTGTPFSILAKDWIKKIAREDPSYLSLFRLLLEATGNVKTTRIMGPSEPSINSAIGLKCVFGEPLGPEYDVANDTFMAFGVTDQVAGLPVPAIIGTDFLKKFKADIRLRPGDPSASCVLIKPYDGRTMSAKCMQPTQEEVLHPRTDTKVIMRKRAPCTTYSSMSDPHKKPKTLQDTGKLVIKTYRHTHPLERLGVGRVTDAAVILVNPKPKGDWVTKQARQMLTDGSISIPGGAAAYVRTNYDWDPKQEEVIFKIHPVKRLRNIEKEDHWPNMTGGVMVSIKGRCYLFVKIDNRGHDKTLVLQHNDLLGDVTPWIPPNDRDRWWRYMQDTEIMGSAREEAAKARNTSDEDTAAGWGEIQQELPEEEDNASRATTRHWDSDEENRPPQDNTEPPVASVDVTMEDVTPDNTARSTMTSSPSPLVLRDQTTEEHIPPSQEAMETGEDSRPKVCVTTAPEPNEEASVSTEASESTDEPDDSGEPRETLEFNMSLTERQINLSSLSRPVGRSRSSRRKHRKAYCAFLSFIRVHQSRMEQKFRQIATTEMLPHLLFPIGHRSPGQSWRTLATIRALLDTGSGLNIGYLPYWLSVFNKYPELVREFGKLSDDERDKLTVNGIDRNGEGTSCTHYIVLKTPFTDNGKEVDLRIALTEGLSCNLIFGLPFIVKAKMAINMWEKFVVSSVFQTTFPLYYHPPELRNSVTAQDGTPLALTATKRTDE